MEDLEELNSTLVKVDQSIPELKEKRGEYLSTLRDVLDVYVLSVMEEEDAIYSLLSKPYHTSLKTISPYQLQFKIMISLPFQQSDIQVERGEPGFVKIKLPSEECMVRSKVWTEACHRGIQKSLKRHMNLWTDDLNYLKQTAVRQWLVDAVDKSLALVGSIPNYKIQRLQLKDKVVLQMEDISKKIGLTIELLPTIVFPSTQLPQHLADVPAVASRNQSCETWFVECHAKVSSDQLWHIWLWEHEKIMIGEHTKLKSMIHVLKALRDGCDWVNLTNYHIRTLVLQAFMQDPMLFEIFNLAELLLQLLLQLRDRLVSREGLPCLWDCNYNLLGGLTGLQKSALARSVTKTRDSLQRLSENYHSFFRLETYTIAPASRKSEADAPAPQANRPTELPSDAPSQCPTEAREQPLRRVSSSEEQLQNRNSSSIGQPQNRYPPSREQSLNMSPPSGEQSLNMSPPSREQPRNRNPSSESPHNSGHSSSNQVQSRNNWWEKFQTVAAGVGAVAVTAVAAYAMVASKNRNKNN